MKRLAGPFLALLTLLAAPSAANAFRCGSRLVSEGDTVAEVVDKCGPPLMKDSTVQQVTKEFRGGTTKNSTIRSDYYLYDFGPNQFIRILTFQDDKLTLITDGAYGGKGEPDRGRCLPPWIGVAEGQLLPAVRYACGEPDAAEQPETIKERVGPVDDYVLFLTREIEEWEFRLEKEDRTSVLRFVNGALQTMFTREDEE